MSRNLLELDPNEIVLHEIKKHPLGLAQIYFVGGFVFILNFLLLFTVIRNKESFGFDLNEQGISVIFMALSILIIVVTIIASRIYKANELIITNESIILVVQNGLFNRKISQLSLGKIEDVSSHQSGILPSMMNYGTLTIETAGEVANFKFTYAPNPNIYAKHIVEAHEQFIRNVGNQEA